MSARPGLRSALGCHIERFLSHHRALGKRFDTEESALRRFDRFLLGQGLDEPEQTAPELFDAFLSSRPRHPARSSNHLLNVLERLFRWLVTQEGLACSPMSSRPRRTTRYRAPFLFSPVQVERLLAAAERLRDGPGACHRARSYRMLFVLMYGLGLRVSEVARLRRGGLDLERRCLCIEGTKFGKSRLVPFGPRMDAALRRSLREHERGRSLSAADPLFSLVEDGRQSIGSQSISRTLHKLLPELGLRVPVGVAPPRLHCLRHSFAVSTWLRWDRPGVDPGARLLHLSVFLGHVNPASTSVYLTVTSELRRQAADRFERFAAPVLAELQP